jgi:hypothetical protein
MSKAGIGPKLSSANPVRQLAAQPPTQLSLCPPGFWRASITRHRRIKAPFRFYSRDGAHGFLCKRGRGRWRRCRSPLRYWVRIGHHVLRVRAIGLRGPAAACGSR